MSSCSGGLFDPSLELGVHLYRMGPLNSYSTAFGGSGDAVGSRMLRSGGATAGGAGACAGPVENRNCGGGDEHPDPMPEITLWKPPSLVERGKVGLDGRGSAPVALFARPPLEPRRAGDVGSGGHTGG